MSLSLFINVMGGIGLILLGMKLMTGGLRQAAGAMLKDMLAKWTRTPRRSGLSQESSEAFPNVLRTAQYYKVVAEMAVEADRELQNVSSVGDKSFLEDRQALLDVAVAVMDKANTAADAFAPEEMIKARDSFEKRYQKFKANILELGASGDLTVEQMSFLLDGFSRFRHMVNQTVKGSHLLHALKDRLNPKVDEAPYYHSKPVNVSGM